MEELKNLLSTWQGKGLAAVLTLLLALLSKRVRDFLTKVLVDYLSARWRQIWYWTTNKQFLASGYVEFSFANDLTAEQPLRSEFDDFIKKERTLVWENGSIGNGKVRTRLASLPEISLDIESVGGQELADMYTDETSSLVSTSQGYRKRRTGTTLKIKWSLVVVRYRSLAESVSQLRRAADLIRDHFAKVVENELPEKRSALLVVFLQKHAEVDQALVLTVGLADDTVTMRRSLGSVEFGARRLDDIIQFLPSYLIKETLRDLLKKHHLIS